LTVRSLHLSGVCFDELLASFGADKVAEAQVGLGEGTGRQKAGPTASAVQARGSGDNQVPYPRLCTVNEQLQQGCVHDYEFIVHTGRDVGIAETVERGA
jgi:hypothetical protein